MAGLFDSFDSPNNAGLLGMATGLLEASGPSTRPVSLSQAVARAMNAGRAASLEAQTNQRRNALTDVQVLQQQMQLAELQRQQQQQAALEDLARQSFRLGGELQGPPAVGETMPTLPPSFDRQAFMRGLPQIAPLQAMQMMQKAGPMKLGAGETLYDPEKNQPIYTAPNKEAAAPSAIQEYQFAQAQGFRGSFQDWITAKARAGATNVQVGLQSPYAGVDSQGNPIVVQPANKPGVPPQVLTGPDGKPIRPATESKPPTEFEAKAGLYATSMTNASQVLNQIEKRGEAGVGIAEVLAPGGQVGANIVRSRDRQSYVQAQRQWVDSINRVRSGANLPEIEYDRAVMTFFPQYGDRPHMILQKQEMRAKEEQAMLQAAGRAAGRVPEQQQNKTLRFDATGRRID